MLTRIQMVNEALQQAGLDSSFQDRGRNWVNILLEKLARRTNYKNLRKTVDTAYLAGQIAYNLPNDFRRIDTMWQIDSSGNQGGIISIREPYEAEKFLTNAQGFPQVVWVDEELGKFQFDSAPASTSGERFRTSYFKSPAQYSLDSADDDVVVEFDDQWTLLEELKALAYEWAEDDREGNKKQEAKEALRDYQRNMFQSDSNSNVPLNQEIFRGTSRRWRRF